MSKEIEFFVLEEKGIPEGLKRKLRIPKHIRLEDNFLFPYVKEELIPKNLEVILFKKWMNFCYRFLGKTDLLSKIVCPWSGFYFDEDSYPKKYYERINTIMKHDDGSEIKKAILLPKKADYWTMIHELLHGSWALLNDEQKEKIFYSVNESGSTEEGFKFMLRVLPFEEIFSLKWKNGESDKKKGYLSFIDLTEGSQLHLIEELISHFFTNTEVKNRWQCLSPLLQKSLGEIGYNMKNPPEVKD